MKKARKRKKNPTRRRRAVAVKAVATHTHKRRKSTRKNPFIIRKRKSARRKNPTARTVVRAAMKPVNLLWYGLAVLFGMVATQRIPQYAMKDKNAGWTGYGANAATALGLGFIGGKAIKDPYMGLALGFGGGAYTALRMLTEQFSPVGQYFKLSGLTRAGDVMAANNLGVIEDAYFPVPVVYDSQGRPIIPQAIVEAAAKALPPAGPAQAAAAPALSGLSRFSRFAH